MRLTTVILIASLVQVSAATFGQRITLNEKNITLKSALREITKQSGYGFVYDGKIVGDNQKIGVSVSNAEIDDAIKNVLTGLNLIYSIDGKIVSIRKKESSFLERLAERWTNIDVGGRVVDQQGSPLVGATVKVKKTDEGTVTDELGNFYLKNVEEGTVLLVSYTGYVSKEIKAEKALGNIVLEISLSKLDEVQVVAYGTTTKRLATGSIGTITAADIEKQPVNNILDAMIGRIAGLQITQNSGIQGAAPKVNIRGRASITASTDPLFIVDGVPVTASQALSYQGAIDGQSFNLLTTLNTADIESVSVLKDADATAIYGSRGANGVILITTKRGKAGKLSVNLKASTGIQEIGHFMDFLNVDQYLAVRKEAYDNDKLIPGTNSGVSSTYAPDLFDLGTYKKDIPHNWQKEFAGGTSINNDLGLTFSGGTENTKYFVSAAYHKEGTVMPGDSRYVRKSIMSNLSNTSQDKKFTLEARTSYTESTLNLLPSDMLNQSTRAPHNQLYKVDGTPNWDTGTFPLANTLQNYFLPTKNFALSGLAGYEFIPGLKLKVTGGLNVSNVNMSQEQPLISLNPTTSTALNATLNLQNTESKNWILEPQAEYSRDFGKHHFSVLAGSTFQKTINQSLSMTGTNFANDNLINNIGSAGTISSKSSYFNPYNYNAIFGRISYNLNQELLANITFRRDGSSRFGEDKKFGNFGAVGLGWIFTQRKTVTDFLPFLSYGKLRGSYGITGNDGVGDFQYISTLNSSAAGYNGQPALTPGGIANPELRWETWKKLETAIELGFFKDRVLLTGTYYRNRSSNQLLSNNISTQSGFYFYTYNFPGVVQTEGFEIELGTKNIKGPFTWNSSFTLSKSDNKLVSYPDFAASNYTFRLAIGESLNVVKGYQFAGLNATGVPTYVLGNGTIGTVTNQNTDRIILGDTDPMFGGMNNEFSYKGFTLSFFVRYDRITGVPNYIPTGVVGALTGGNYSTYVLNNRWQQPGDEANTTVPRFTTSTSTYTTTTYTGSDQMFMTRHIFRLSNAALGFNLPTSLVNKVKLARVQVYANAQNLYVFDKYRKYELDPKTSNTSMPPLRTIVFGLNASF